MRGTFSGLHYQLWVRCPPRGNILALGAIMPESRDPRDNYFLSLTSWASTLVLINLEIIFTIEIGENISILISSYFVVLTTVASSIIALLNRSIINDFILYYQYWQFTRVLIFIFNSEPGEESQIIYSVCDLFTLYPISSIRARDLALST